MAKPDLKSLFSFLEPGQQEPKVRIPYRAPAEIPEYEITKPLKPGEVKEVVPTKKQEGVDIKGLVKKIGGKPKVVESKYEYEKPIDVPPSATPPAEQPAQPAEPNVIDELEGGMPDAPRPDIEEVVKEQTKGLSNVEEKQVRNAIVMKDQQETTKREMASDSTVWDEIWPALVPIAMNALIGGDYEATFNIASDTLDKIQKEKKEWYKLRGAGKKGGKGPGTDQMALEKLRQEGRMQLEGARGGGRQTLEGARAIYKDLLNEKQQGYIGNRESKKALEGYGYKNLEEARKHINKLEQIEQTQGAATERKGQDFVTVEHPVTKQHTSISRKELLAIPFDQRPKVVQQTRGGSTGLITKSYVLNNKNITEYRDRQTGEIVKKIEHDVGDTSPYIPGASKKQTAGLDPVVKDFRKESTDAIENQKDLMKAIQMIRSKNVYENTQAIFTMIKKIEGRMTEEDAKRYTAPLDYWGQLMNEARKKGIGKYDENLIQGMQNAALRSLNGIRDSYKNLPTRYLKYAQNITQNIDIPDKDKHLAKVFETPYMEDKEYQEAIKKK